jgi:hypothetical protein
LCRCSSLLRFQVRGAISHWFCLLFQLSSVRHVREVALFIHTPSPPENLGTIGSLLLQFLQGECAVHWLRTLNILEDERYTPFLQRFHGNFMPRLVFCAFGSDRRSAGNHREEGAVLEEVEAEIEWSASSGE